MVNKDLKRIRDIIADCEKIFADIIRDDFENPSGIDWMVKSEPGANNLHKMKAGLKYAIIELDRILGNDLQ